MLRFSDARNFGRTLTGLALIVGPVLMLIGSVVSPDTSNDNKLKELNKVAAHKSAYLVGSLLFLLGTLVLLAASVGIIHLFRNRRVTLGQVAGSLLLLGTAATTAFYAFSIVEYEMVNQTGLDRAQMAKFRESVEAIRRGEEPPEDGYRGEYVVELAREEGDPVPKMLARIEAELERFRIHFDSWALQSKLEERLPEFLPKLDTYEKDGALWARSSAYGDDDDRVIVRSPEQGGTPTYRAADVVYLADKLDRGFDRAIYVLGADHHGTRNWYAAIARMLGYDPDRVEVLIYQLVHLTRGGEQTRISKRRGDVVFLDELVDEVGVDAARWYLVNRGPDQTIEIDVDLAAERSVKNPVYYVQYAHARIAGIRRNAGEAEVSSEVPPNPAPEERDLIKRLAELPALAAEAAERRGPQAIPTYAIRVADEFHRFYDRHRVLESDEQAFRLGLCTATQNVIARCLDLVGVTAPERM